MTNPDKMEKIVFINPYWLMAKIEGLRKTSKRMQLSEKGFNAALDQILKLLDKGDGE